MSETIASPQFRARPSKIPKRILSQATSASQYFGLEAVARPSRYRSASRSFERSLGDRWPLNPDHSLTLREVCSLQHKDEGEESDGSGNEDMVKKAYDEMDPAVLPVAAAGCQEENALLDTNHRTVERCLGWDASLIQFDCLDQSAIPLLHTAIICALETLDNRLEHWYHLGLQGWPEEPYIASGQGRLIDISGLSQNILADCTLAISMNTNFEELKPTSSTADSNMPPQMLSIRAEFQREILVRLLGMLQHIVAVAAPDSRNCHKSVLRWKLVVRGSLDLSLDLRALGSTLRLVLCVSRTQRKKILAFLGHPLL